MLSWFRPRPTAHGTYRLRVQKITVNGKEGIVVEMKVEERR